MLKTDEVCKEINQDLTKKLQDVGVLCERYCKLDCPVDTGALRASIGSIVYPYEGKVIIYANTDYAVLVHEGHGNYEGVKYLEQPIMDHLIEIRQTLWGR